MFYNIIFISYTKGSEKMLELEENIKLLDSLKIKLTELGESL